jgi:hypothetical protein
MEILVVFSKLIDNTTAKWPSSLSIFHMIVF